MDPDYTGVGHTEPMWRREWLGHLSQQSKAPTPEGIDSSWRLTWLRTLPQGWVANSPSPLPGNVADSAPVVPTVSVDGRNDTSPTFETTGDPLLLIGRRGGRRLQDDRVVSFDLDAFQ